jgi:hypothetical protein
VSRLLGFLVGLLATMAAVAVIVTIVPSRVPAPVSGADGDAPSTGVPEPLPDAAAPVDAAAASPGRESADGQDEVVETVDRRPVMPEDASLPDGPRPDAAADAPRWYTFWQPFHNRISAEGFLVRLERVTGLDYRIVSPQPGEYQVAFAYRDEAERQAHLAAIEAATGLVLRNTVL